MGVTKQRRRARNGSACKCAVSQPANAGWDDDRLPLHAREDVLAVEPGLKSAVGQPLVELFDALFVFANITDENPN
jgi:hypothetical protein